MSNQRLVGISYAVFALLVGFVMERALGEIFAAAGQNWLNDTLVLGLEGWSYTTIIAYFLGVAGGVGCWLHPRMKALSLEVAGELRKVTWPTRKETQAATVAVLITTVLFAVVLGFFDYAWSFITNQIYRGAGS